MEEDRAKALWPLMIEMCGNIKRHREIINGLLMLKEKTRVEAARYLAKKLRSDKRSAGIILSGQLYPMVVGTLDPSPLEMDFLTNTLFEQGLHLSVVFGNSGKGPMGVFLVIHRDVQKAVDYANQIKEIAGSESNQYASNIATAIAITENFGNSGRRIEDLVTAMEKLKDNSCFCITINFFLAARIDPRQLDALLTQNGYVVMPLYRPKSDNDPVEPEVYQYFQNLIGVLISRTQEGIDWATSNIGSMINIATTAESGLIEENIKNAKFDGTVGVTAN